MLYVEGDKLIVEPSATRLGTGPVVVANKDNGFDVAHHLSVKWLAQSSLPVTQKNGVYWHLTDKKDNSEGMFVLSYSLDAEKTIELFRHEKLAGIIVWINQQFVKLIPDLLTWNDGVKDALR